MGRLREKLDDDLPELTGGLVSMIWPHYLRTIPSLAMVEFSVDWREMKEPQRLKKGTEAAPSGKQSLRTGAQHRDHGRRLYRGLTPRRDRDGRGQTPRQPHASACSKALLS
jgi:type VI protein secretion system component VasA